MPDRRAAVDDRYPYPLAACPAPGVLETGCDQTPLLAESRIVGRVTERPEVVVVDALYRRVPLELPLYPGELLLPNLPGAFAFNFGELQKPCVYGGQRSLDLPPGFLVG